MRYGLCGAGAAGVIPFVSGDEIVQPFLILAESTVVDLTDCAVTAVIWAGGAMRGDIAVTVEIVNPTGSPTPHGLARIVESESAKLAGSSLPFLRFAVIKDGRMMQTAGAGLRQISGPNVAVSGVALLRAPLVGVRASDLAVPSTYDDDDYAAFVAAA